MTVLQRWRRRAQIDQLLYGTQPAQWLQRPGRVLAMLGLLLLGLWAGADHGRRMQWHTDFAACLEGAAIEARR